MKTKILLLAFLPLFSLAQIKIKDLPTTTTGTTADYLLKDRSDGGSGATQKITIANVISTYTIVTGTVTSGIYTPTITVIANMTSPSGATSQYMRVGNVVTVSGSFSASITANATNTQFSMTIPVASSFGSYTHAIGTGVQIATTAAPFSIIGNSTTVRTSFTSIGTGGSEIDFIYTYRIE